MMMLAPMEARLLNLQLQGQRLQWSRQLLLRLLLRPRLSRLLPWRRLLSQQLSADRPERCRMLLRKNEHQWHKMESFLLVTSYYYRLLMITAQYFQLKSLLLVSAHYYRLLPITSITVQLFFFNCSNGSITTLLLLHYYKWSSITAITAHYFYLITSHYYHYYPLLPH
jgi:hypothetical protein